MRQCWVTRNMDEEVRFKQISSSSSWDFFFCRWDKDEEM